jgi:hypothetical protein
MNACRKVCGPTGLAIPARRVSRRTTRPAPCRSSRPPSADRKIGPSTRSPMARSITRAVRGASGMVTTEEVGDLVEDKSEPLRGFDHPQRGDRLGWVEPVAAQGAVRFGEQAAPFVVAQCLQVYPGCLCHMAAAQPAHNAPDPGAAAARVASASST